MSKSKLFGIGLAGALSLLSVGCAKNQAPGKPEPTRKTQTAAYNRIQCAREDISVHHIAPKKDYIKSVNLLLSLYNQVIPLVEKDASRLGIDKALTEAFAVCRTRGALADNSVAYNFTDVVIHNYGRKSCASLAEWRTQFRIAGQEAARILAEPESVHRKFVPKTAHGFERRSVSGDEPGWFSCDSIEADWTIRQQALAADRRLKNEY